MEYSVLTKVTNATYKSQEFYLYKHGEEGLTSLTLEEANKLADILSKYPSVFPEIQVVPRTEDEIKLLTEFWGEDGRNLDFAFEEVSDDCVGILDSLEETFDNTISGIDRKETVKQTFENK